MYTKCVAKNKYRLSIKNSRNSKNQSQNNDDNNNGENNSNNTNLARTLLFQVDTGKNVVWNSRKSSSRKTFFKGVFYCHLFDCSSTCLFACLCYLLGDFNFSQWFCTFVRYSFIAVTNYHIKNWQQFFFLFKYLANPSQSALFACCNPSCSRRGKPMNA